MAHTAGATTNMQKKFFKYRLIAKGLWLLQSLTSLPQIFLWAYAKDYVFQVDTMFIEQIRQRVMDAISSIDRKIIKKKCSGI